MLIRSSHYEDTTTALVSAARRMCCLVLGKKCPIRLDGLRCPALGVLYENGGVFSASVEPVGYLILRVCKDLRVAASPYGL